MSETERLRAKKKQIYEDLKDAVERECVDSLYEHIKKLESDRRRLEWLALNNARVWLQDGWYDIHGNGGTCIVSMVDDWRDAIDKAMQESE